MPTEEKNKYSLANFRTESPAFQDITFYKLNPDGSYEQGTTLEEVISCAISRLADLNSRFECKENEEAIAHLKEAFRFLEMRTADRTARGVEGKHEE